MQTPTINYGVIGTGHMGNYHVNVARRLDATTFKGIYDADPERAKLISEKYKVTHYPSVAELLDDCDAVSIAVPTHRHYETAKQALSAGKHVLIEKPITETPQQAEELIHLAESKNLILHVGHVERFNGAVQELGKIIESPKLWESRRLGPFTGRILDVGVVMDLMIHDIDICLRTVKSKVVSVNAIGTFLEKSKHEDAANAQIHFENGCIASISVSRLTQEKVRTLSVSQKDCYLFLDFTTQDLQLHRQASSNTITLPDKISYKQESLIERLFIHKENPLQSEIQHFLDCISQGEPSYASNLLDLETLKLSQEILRQIHDQ